MSIHKTVLLEEAVEMLDLKEGSVVVDATLGAGGHTREILKRIGDEGILIGFDQDISALENFTEFPISNFQFPSNSEFSIFKIKNQYLVNSNFENLADVLKILGIEKVDAILADLGFSSDQLEDQERGISFQKDSPLDMRLDRGNELTAEKIVNEYSEEELKGIIKEFGDERYAGKIARNICLERKKKEIKTTKELVSIIERSVPGEYRRGKLHFATRTFQALRIETNRELEVLKKLIGGGIGILSEKGRMAIITFHSGEDRIVKNLFREYARGCICPPSLPICRCGNKEFVKLVTRKPIEPSEKEVLENPRARSAKLRVVEKK